MQALLAADAAQDALAQTRDRNRILGITLRIEFVPGQVLGRGRSVELPAVVASDVAGWDGHGRLLTVASGGSRSIWAHRITPLKKEGPHVACFARASRIAWLWHLNRRRSGCRAVKGPVPRATLDASECTYTYYQDGRCCQVVFIGSVVSLRARKALTTYEAGTATISTFRACAIFLHASHSTSVMHADCRSP